MASSFADLAEVPLGPNQGLLAALDATGDTKLIWDRTNPAEVENAKASFDRLTSNHRYVAYSVKGEKGEKGEIIRKFDPNAERIILAPPMVGG